MNPEELTRALLDPTAPLPAGWPSGALGAFLLFFIPVGGGIPLGVLMARDAGVPPVITALIYLLSDVFLALTMEPVLAALRWAGRVVPFLGRIGNRLSRMTGAAGLQSRGARGPLGLILLSFAISPTTGRAAASAAGHGFIRGWTLAIIGDMGYFAILMASTLWLSGVLGDERLAVGAALVLGWVLPMVLGRLIHRKQPKASPAPARNAAKPPAAVGTAPLATGLLPGPSLVEHRARTSAGSGAGSRGGRKKARRRF